MSLQDQSKQLLMLLGSGCNRPVTQPNSLIQPPEDASTLP